MQYKMTQTSVKSTINIEEKNELRNFLEFLEFYFI